MNCVSTAWCGAWIFMNSESEACWTRKLSPLHIVSPAIDHKEIGFGRRNGDGMYVTAEIWTQFARFADKSLWKAIRVAISQCVSLFSILVTKLWDMMIRLCMCKGRTCNAIVLDFNSGWYMTKILDINLSLTGKRENKHSIKDTIY